jgi:hypothetical protein
LIQELLTRGVRVADPRDLLGPPRHTAAMTCWPPGVDTSAIALWLGHEQERTTHIYVHADLEFKRRTLDGITLPEAARDDAEHPTRCSPPSRVYSPPVRPPRAKSAQVASHTLAFPRLRSSGAAAQQPRRAARPLAG